MALFDNFWLFLHFSPNWTILSILSHIYFFGLCGLFWPCGLCGLQRPKFLAFSGTTKQVLLFEPIIKKLTHPNSHCCVHFMICEYHGQNVSMNILSSWAKCLCGHFVIKDIMSLLGILSWRAFCPRAFCHYRAFCPHGHNVIQSVVDVGQTF